MCVLIMYQLSSQQKLAILIMYKELHFPVIKIIRSFEEMQYPIKPFQIGRIVREDDEM